MYGGGSRSNSSNIIVASGALPLLNLLLIIFTHWCFGCHDFTHSFRSRGECDGTGTRGI